MFTQRSLFKKELLHREVDTQTSFPTQKHKLRNREIIYTAEPVQANAFRHRSVYTQKPLHREALKPRIEAFNCTEKSSHRSFLTQTHLRTGAFAQTCLRTKLFAHKSFYTQKLHTEKLLHTESLRQRTFVTRQKSQFYLLTFDLHFVQKGDAAPENIRISRSVCASDTHDLRRGLPKDKQNLQCTTCFDGQGLAAPAAQTENRSIGRVKIQVDHLEVIIS